MSEKPGREEMARHHEAVHEMTQPPSPLVIFLDDRLAEDWDLADNERARREVDLKSWMLEEHREDWHAADPDDVTPGGLYLPGPRPHPGVFGYWAGSNSCEGEGCQARVEWCRLQCVVAMVYRDHPDWREEWRAWKEEER